MALAPSQTLSIVGLSDATPDWTIRPKASLPPPTYSAALIGAAFLFNVLPFLLEARRSARAAAREEAAR